VTSFATRRCIHITSSIDIQYYSIWAIQTQNKFRYDSMRAEVSFYRRKTGWLGCGWIYLPTFGLLWGFWNNFNHVELYYFTKLFLYRDNLEICEEDNPTCPVFPGEMRMKWEASFIGQLKVNTFCRATGAWAENRAQSSVHQLFENGPQWTGKLRQRTKRFWSTEFIYIVTFSLQVPYQLKLRIINNRQLGEELICVVFQARVDIWSVKSCFTTIWNTHKER
jgi:hypothetical protein